MNTSEFRKQRLCLQERYIIKHEMKVNMQLSVLSKV